MTASRDCQRPLHVWAPGFSGFGGGITAFGQALVESLALRAPALVLWGRDDAAGTWRGYAVRGAGNWPLPWRKLAYAWQLLRGVWTDRPRLVVCTHLNFGPVALLARKLFGVEYVIVGHGVEVGPDVTWLRRRALKRARAVWVVSRWTQDRMIALGVDPGRISIIGNTVDESRFRPEASLDAARTSLGLPAHSRLILTVARLDPDERYKGCDAVLRALPGLRERLGPVDYVIVGQGGDQQRLERLAGELGIASSVHFAGFVADDALAAYYAHADAFAMPSQGEGFGIVFLEAMVSGTPVLGGCLDGTPDALDDGRLGVLVDPRDDAEVARGLEELLTRSGPEAWFQPERLRADCLARHGRVAFAARVDNALVHAGAG